MDYTRRRFLITGATTTLAALAGCSTEEPVEGGDHNDNDGGGGAPSNTVTEGPTNTPTMTPAETATPIPSPTPEGESNITIQSSALKVEEDSYDSTAYILATVKNTGTAPSGGVTLKGRFYDSSDNLLDDTTGSMHYLKPGEVWEAYLPFLDDAEKVESHKIDGEFETEPPRLEVEGLTVTDAQMQKGSYDASVVGTIQNEKQEAIDYLGAHARFWRGDVLIAPGLDNITDVPAGENWSFEASYFGYGDRWKDADNFDIVPVAQIY